MLKKINSLLYIMLYIFLIVILSFNVIAAENNRPSLFDDISKFFKSIFKEEESITNNIDDSTNNYIEQFQLIKLERLQNIINSSDCIQQLPKHSAIKLKIFDEYGNKNEFFIYNGPKIDEYKGQKIDLDIRLSLNNILLMERSINVDGELKSFINSKDLELNYNFLKALKYRNVLLCIEDSEIVIEESKKTQEEKVLINETQENITLQEIEPITVIIINKEELTPKKLKYLFDDFENNVPYIIISNDSSDYSNLRTIKLLTNWNYAIESIDYSSIKASNRVSNKNLIFVTYSCNTEILSLTTNKEECINLIEGKRGMINFYEYDNKNVLVIIGGSGQYLVDSVSILSNYGLFDFNDSDIIVIDDNMYKLVLIPKKIKLIQGELRSIYDKSEEYEHLISDEKLYKPFVPFHPGQWFRAIHEGIYKYNSYILSEGEREILNRYDFGELAKKGNNFMDQRELVRRKIKSLKSQIGTGTLNLIIDKKSINLETLQDFESRLETSQKNFEDLTKEYELLTINMTQEIKWKIIDINSLIS